MIKCSFCGSTFQMEDGRSGCNGCPMSRVCNKYKCPHCGYEIPKEPGLVSFIKKFWKGKGQRD